jgi:hypothetical protein
MPMCGLIVMSNYGELPMVDTNINLDKLKDSLTFMSQGAKQYRAKVNEQKEKKRVQEQSQSDTNLPSESTNGNTLPSG